MAFVEGFENGLEVNHIDRVRTNNNPSNLEWITHRENVRHSSKMGAYTKRGNSNPRAKLKEKDIPIIRKMISEGLYQQDIAVEFGVSNTAISLINRGINWRGF